MKDDNASLTITIWLSQGAYLELREGRDGATQICVRAGKGGRLRYNGEHGAKFTDLLAVLNAGHVKNAIATMREINEETGR